MCNVCSKNSGKIKLTDLVNEIFLLKGDASRREFLRYKAIAKNIYRELNLFKIKEAKRVFLDVDKHTNSIKLPSDNILFSSISVINDCNKLIPLVMNSSIADQDIIDATIDKKCKCNECDCQNEDCGSIYKYELITETVSMVMPDNSFQDFEKTIIKRIDKDGQIWQEINEPVIIFDENGVHTSTEIVPKIEAICKLDIKECGCVEDTESNKSKLSECSFAQIFAVESGSCNPCYAHNNPYTYNINEEETRVYFDTNFDFDKVLLRYYSNESNSEIEIPIIAKEAVLLGTEWKASLFSNEKSRYGVSRTRDFKFEYVQACEELDTLIHRMTVKEFINTMLPKRIAPTH